MVRVWLLGAALLLGCRAFAPAHSASPQARVSDLPNRAILPEGGGSLEPPPLGEESHPQPRPGAPANELGAVPEATDGNAGPPPPPDPDARRAWLKARLDEVGGQPGLAGAKIGILVADFETGQVLYARNEKMPLNAASNV
jgi:hypothetical protein